MLGLMRSLKHPGSSHFSTSRSCHCIVNTALFFFFSFHQVVCFPMRRLARGRRGEVVLLWFLMPWWQWAIQKEQDRKLMVNVPWGRKRRYTTSTSSNACCRSYQKLLLCTSAVKPSPCTPCKAGEENELRFPKHFLGIFTTWFDNFVNQ